jgi:hypothetical protein
MICVRNLWVPAINMIARTLHRRAGRWILFTYGEHMLIVMLVMREVQMSLVHVINMPLMLDGNMPTVRTVGMDMFCMFGMRLKCHRSVPFPGSATCPRKLCLAYLVLVLHAFPSKHVLYQIGRVRGVQPLSTPNECGIGRRTLQQLNGAC